MPMKRVWVMTQKQTSKGYFSRRGYRSDGKPVFTKIMANAVRFDTEAEIMEYHKNLLVQASNDIGKIEQTLKVINELAPQTYVDLQDFENKVNKSGVVTYYNNHYYNRGRDYKEVITEYITNSINQYTSQLDQHKAELKFFTDELYCRNVPVGIRFIENRKTKVDFMKNEADNMVCIACGGVVPDVTYLSIGYSVKICACCLDSMMPDIKKAIDEAEPEIKDIWSKERFLTGLE